jgi:hypothetical protein
MIARASPHRESGEVYEMGREHTSENLQLLLPPLKPLFKTLRPGRNTETPSVQYSSPTDGMTCNSVIALDAGALNSENSVKNEASLVMALLSSRHLCNLGAVATGF